MKALQFHWIPRIICIIAIGFVSVFAADAFESNHSVWQQLLTFFIHLVPSFILIGFLYVSWKWEFAGGILFTAVGIIMTPIIFLHNYNTNHFSLVQCMEIILLITFPFIIAGILFIISHFRARKHLYRLNKF
ncbi:hypothetical protein QWZ08_06865 [Ferruginibacter paludis]|uniref:DUF7670 domain-containing protein n=1 Tax=Ferruginibacter paludis TaxID=1310417 RepID=UPI0025B52D51|nr:hypothetical protein [Ferruginibacter paludis]MDN3655337.1 hypothetical protein [Ferruginibacter paludis]